MIKIENKMTGVKVETKVSNWRNGLNAIKCDASYDGIKIDTKAINVINNIKDGYEDKFIKAYIA